ncbi:MAG: aldo/keto reductase [Blastocatellia bacterium]|nr:aldo/keto reductase [Blastocatellia bacterium]
MARRATREGTERFRARFAEAQAAGHFREAFGLWISSIGIGTYLGASDAETDRAYGEAIAWALQRGSNVIDTAINYRCQRSERVIGEVLARLVAAGTIARDEVLVATKGGYIPFDGHPPRTRAEWQRYLEETFFRPGILRPEDVVGGIHSLAPRYLEHQLETSLRNLRLETVDVYYLHNPEQQLEEISREEFRRRMRAAFAWLEEKVAEGKIGVYGTATWEGYRVPPDERVHLSLAELVALAKEVGGTDHHFRVIQLPYNLLMPEASLLRTQTLGGWQVSVLEAAEHLGIVVMASAPLLQGRLAAQWPVARADALKGLTAAQRALQIVRSTPGITVALVGMSRRAHVEENLRLADIRPLSREEWRQILFIQHGVG